MSYCFGRARQGVVNLPEHFAAQRPLTSNMIYYHGNQMLRKVSICLLSNMVAHM